MDFVLLALAVSLVYAVLPANVWRLVICLSAGGVLAQAGGADPWHITVQPMAAYFVAYALNTLVDNASATTHAMRLRRSRVSV